MICPCCKQPARDPDAVAVGLAIGATRLECRLLEVVWRHGKDVPVSTAVIIEAMYRDDELPDDPATGFKVTLCHLRKKLRGTGYAIENVHYGCGYRLVTDQDRQKDGSAFRTEPVTVGAEWRVDSVTARSSPL